MILSRSSAMRPRILAPARAYRNSGRWWDAVTAFGAGIIRRERTVTLRDDRGNTTTGTVSEPDYEAQRRTRDASAGRRARQASIADFLLENSIRTTALFDGQSIVGWVFAEKKDWREATLRARIGDVIFELPYQRGR